MTTDTACTTNRSPLAALRAMPATISLVEAGRFGWGMVRTTAYRMNAEGRFPCEVIQVGTRFHVRTADLARALGIDPADLLEA